MRKPQFAQISFYIVAHADDWQLFMQPNAYRDIIAPDSKVVFVVTTAGDAGFDEKYWAAREEGMKSSIRYCLAPFGAITEHSTIKEMNRHPVNHWSGNNVSSYFLRLPDGGLDGKGFSNYSNQSLSKFREQQINKVTPVDNSTTYNSWSDLTETLQTIIQFESERMQDVAINYLNPDKDKNPNDHIDHIATAQAVQETDNIQSFKQRLFVGYSVSNGVETLEPEDLFWKAGMFAAYEKAVYDISGYSTLQESITTYQRWCLSSPKFSD